MKEIDVFQSAQEHSKALEQGDYTAEALASACLKQAGLCEHLNIFLHLDKDEILRQARASDERRKKKGSLGPLDGIPVSIKDNISVQGEPLTAASKILEPYVAPYDATVIERLRASGAVLFGRTNMDEFAMGSSTENSAFAKTQNPWNPEYVPGGSSGGAAACVVSGITPLALGSDTGGSIRQPAAFCGGVGLKPTYGRVSRYGLAAYASSFDQIGPLARNVGDCALLLKAISAYDPRDSNSSQEAERHPIREEVAQFDTDFMGLRIGVVLPEPGSEGFDPDIITAGEAAVNFFQEHGAEIVELKSEYEKFIIPTYYILATAEASSNLSRYDGIRYGYRDGSAKDLLELYVGSRTKGFGPEVKRRILLGTFVLSSGYYDAYYKTAQQVRRLIAREYTDFFEQCDIILQPTSPISAWKFGAKSQDPVAMYQSDILTIGANLAGLPAISVPAGRNQEGLPIGLQLLAAPNQENELLEIAQVLEQIENFSLDHKKIPLPYPKASEKLQTSKGASVKLAKKTKKPKPKKKKVEQTVKKKKATKKKTSKKKAAKKKVVRKKASKKKVSKKKVSKKKKAAKKKAKKKTRKKK